MSDQWDIYFGKANDELASFCVDLGIHDMTPIADKPYLIWVWIRMQNPREDGLSTNAEFQTLCSIEDKVSEEIIKKYNAVQVGRVTTSGRREFYYYSDKVSDLDSTVNNAMSQFQTYQFQSGTKEDREWSQYHEFLYPSPTQLQCIYDRHVVDDLKKRGDPLTVPREVNHWIYFPNESTREEYINRVKTLGFVIANKDKVDTNIDDLPYSLRIYRKDKVDLDSINKVTVELTKLASEIGGDYDGWETPVKKWYHRFSRILK